MLNYAFLLPRSKDRMKVKPIFSIGQGLQQIVNLKASINLGLSFRGMELKSVFPNTIQVWLPFFSNQKSLILID
jgi:hypothetical protein